MTKKRVEGAEGNAARFHNSKLAEELSAHAYVESEWNKDAIIRRYKWVFSYNPMTVPV